MAFKGLVWYAILLLSLFASTMLLLSIRSKEETKEFVLTLDHSNFAETIKKHDFIVIKFYTPGCGHCKSLAPKYEIAAAELSKHDPPLVLAKFDADEEANKEIAKRYNVKSFPSLKILRNGGRSVQDYNGPREAEGIVSYVKRQGGPASVEIKTVSDATQIVGDNNTVAVGVFPKFSGKEFDSFIALSEKLRIKYDFAHTLDAKLLPRGDSSVAGPLVRVFKPFDELFVDSKDFDEEALEKFIKESSLPFITIFDNTPTNLAYVAKFFDILTTIKAMLLTNFTGETAESLKSKFSEVATSYKGQNIAFLIGDASNSQGALRYFGLEMSQVPLIYIQSPDSKKYLKANVETDQIESWFKDFKDGNIATHKRSEPIPVENNGPVKVVVAKTLDDMVFKSGKNVLIEIYAPWCKHCQKLVPILDEVAFSFKNEPSVIIAKLDATTNDLSTDLLDVKAYPTIYFISESGNIVLYEGDMTKEDFISFIEENSGVKSTFYEEELIATKVEETGAKEEL